MGKLNKSFLFLLSTLIIMVLGYQNCGKMTSFGNGDPYEGLDTQVLIDDGPGAPVLGAPDIVTEVKDIIKICVPRNQDSLLSQLDITIKSGDSIQDNIIVFSFYDSTGKQLTALSGTPQEKYTLNYQLNDVILIEIITVSGEEVTINYSDTKGENRTELFSCVTSVVP